MSGDDRGARPLSRRERRMLAGSERNLRDDTRLRDIARHHRDSGGGENGTRRPVHLPTGLGLGIGCLVLGTTALVLGPGSALALGLVGLLVLAGVALRRSMTDD